MEKLTPAMQEEFDALLKKIVKRPQTNGFESKLTIYLNRHLNPILVFGILNKYKRLQNIDLLDDLPPIQQQTFARTIISNVFSKIRSKQEIEQLTQNFLGSL